MIDRMQQIGEWQPDHFVGTAAVVEQRQKSLVGETDGRSFYRDRGR